MSEVQVRNSLPQLLVESGLLSEADVRQLLDDNPDRVATATDFAEFLVQAGHLTQWQADKLLQGKHRGFQLGPYRLLRHLAKGGMSSLYVARHKDADELCALKVLPPAKADQDDASYLARFLREARLACRLRHPNIIRVDEVIAADPDEGGVHFMAMELLEGHDLFNKVARQGPLPVREAAEIMRQAACGLQYAHEEGLVHRDIKPGNVYVTKQGRVKILDLGLAGLIEDAYQENLTREYNERVLGTADYLAPEQAVDSHRADARADLYALGCTFYFVLSGRPPFTEGTLPQRILAHQTSQPKSVRSFRDDVPTAILELLDHMLVKKRVDRVQTAQEVADRLQQWLDDNADDPRFDERPVLLDGEQRAGRPLQKIQPAQKRASETPTDSIRAAETQTAPSVDQLPADVRSGDSSAAVADSETSILQDPIHEPAQYSAEFADFLGRLDHAWKVDTVMDADFRQRQLQSLSVVATPKSQLGDHSDTASPTTSPRPAQQRQTGRHKSPSQTEVFAGLGPALLVCGLLLLALLASFSAIPLARALQRLLGA